MASPVNKKNAGNLSRWVILGALGLLLIVAQRLAKDIVYTVFAIGLLMAGGAGVFGWWQTRSVQRDNLLSLAGSAAMIVVGLWILRNPETFDEVVNIIIGLVLIVAGVYWLSFSLKPVRNTLMIVLGAVAIILGVIIASTHAGTTWLVTAEGVSLIYTAVTGLLSEKIFGR